MGRDVQTWITGDARTGKTTQLVEAFQQWLETEPSSAAIIFAANHSTRQQLTQQLTRAIGSRYPVVVKTPLGFVEDEVNLFSPLWWENLNLKPQFPLRLRSETEQDLALRLWHDVLLAQGVANDRAETRLVRIMLDILQLAGASGTPLSELPMLLSTRLSPEEKAALSEIDEDGIFEVMTQLIRQWRDWCLERGFLTYGLIYYLYSQVLLPHPTYQDHLKRRYGAIFADDVDDYPAIALDLAKRLLQNNATAWFTFNPSGKVRFGLGADPDTWENLAQQCEVISLAPSTQAMKQERPADSIPVILEKITDASNFTMLPDSIQHLPHFSRSQMLRTTAETIIAAIKAKKATPEDIAIIAPGLDEIARYTLITLFTDAGIAVSPLNEQRPLMSSAYVRALLTLVCLVYPDLGRWLDNSAIAEMLVVLTKHSVHKIDPVRAGLIADYCYQADPSSPRLLDIKTFPRWDRIGYQAQTAYDQLRDWIQQQQTSRETIDLVDFFNQGIQQFLWKGNNLAVAELASLRELTETAQHYLEVQKRSQEQAETSFLEQHFIPPFIQLIKQGTITANPYPLPNFNQSSPVGITLSNIFQYRSQRTTHRWQFWLDVASPLWLKQGAANLFASGVFLRNNHQQSNPERQAEEHLQRILKDLLNRSQERVYLCQSDLDINGTEQNGILLSLVAATTPLQHQTLPD